MTNQTIGIEQILEASKHGDFHIIIPERFKAYEGAFRCLGYGLPDLLVPIDHDLFWSLYTGERLPVLHLNGNQGLVGINEFAELIGDKAICSLFFSDTRAKPQGELALAYYNDSLLSRARPYGQFLDAYLEIIHLSIELMNVYSRMYRFGKDEGINNIDFGDQDYPECLTAETTRHFAFFKTVKTRLDDLSHQIRGEND